MDLDLGRRTLGPQVLTIDVSRERVFDTLTVTNLSTRRQEGRSSPSLAGNPGVPVRVVTTRQPIASTG